MQEIRNQVRSYIETETFTNGEIKDNTLIFSEGYFDSMGFVRLITFLEEQFEITISDYDLIEENFESIDAILQFIALRKTENSCAVLQGS